MSSFNVQVLDLEDIQEVQVIQALKLLNLKLNCRLLTYNRCNQPSIDNHHLKDLDLIVIDLIEL